MTLNLTTFFTIETKELSLIDYDLVQVGPAIMDFGLPYMMWLGSRFTDFDYRKDFIKTYLKEANLPFDQKCGRYDARL